MARKGQNPGTAGIYGLGSAASKSPSEVNRAIEFVFEIPPSHSSNSFSLNGSRKIGESFDPQVVQDSPGVTSSSSKNGWPRKIDSTYGLFCVANCTLGSLYHCANSSFCQPTAEGRVRFDHGSGRRLITPQRKLSGDQWDENQHVQIPPPTLGGNENGPGNPATNL